MGKGIRKGTGIPGRGGPTAQAGKVSSSRFVAEFAGMKKAETSVSRFIPGSIAVAGFLDRHPKLSRFIAHIPGASKFLHLPAACPAEALAKADRIVPHV